jgi:hypothetical protein
MSRAVVPPIDLPQLLDWYACYCITLAERCEQPRTARWLRILSVDLAFTAERLRQLGPIIALSERSPHGERRLTTHEVRAIRPRDVQIDAPHAADMTRKVWRLPTLVVAVLIFWLFAALG